jgi:hypothetical protein
VSESGDSCGSLITALLVLAVQKCPIEQWVGVRWCEYRWGSADDNVHKSEKFGKKKRKFLDFAHLAIHVTRKQKHTTPDDARVNAIVT